MKNLIAIRHPNADIASGICYGQLDVGIVEGWQASVVDILNHGVFQPHSKIQLISSPLTRCVLLSEAIVAQSSKFNLTKDDRLKELNFGDWEGVAWDDINAQDLDLWSQDYQNIPIPNGESWQDLKLRCHGFLDDIEINHSQELVVLVTHAGVIRTIKHLVNGTDLNELFSKPVPYAVPIKLRED